MDSELESNLSGRQVLPTLWRDTENFYLYKEFNKDGNRLIKKNFETCHPAEDKDSLCSICCDEMKIATVLSCDGKHMYH